MLFRSATVSFPVGTTDMATANGVAVGPDGRIVVAGGAATSTVETSHPDASGQIVFYSVPVLSPAAVRLTAGGQLDPTFGSGGRVLVTFPGVDNNDGSFYAVSILADGRVQLAGSVRPGGAVVRRPG